MKTIFSFLFVVFPIIAPAQSFQLKGDTHSHAYDHLTIYLYQLGVGDMTYTSLLDSTTIVDGKYLFTLKAPEEPFMVRLMLPMKDRYFSYGLPEAECIAEEGVITIDYGEIDVTLTGGKRNCEYDRCILKPTRETRQRVKVHLDSLNEIGLYDNDYIKEQYSLLIPQTIQYISDNISNPIGAYLFLGRPKEYFPDESYQRLYQSVAPIYRQRYEQRLLREQQEREYTVQSQLLTRKGQRYRDFSTKTIEGKDVLFSDYVHPGSVTLLDFWASWCGPCRAEAPEMIRLYEQYNEKGLNIIGLSLDNNKQSWLKAIDELRLPWQQLCSLQAWKDEAVKKYAVQSVPYVILIDKNGNLSEKNVHGDKLEELIKQLINE